MLSRAKILVPKILQVFFVVYIIVYIKPFKAKYWQKNLFFPGHFCAISRRDITPYMCNIPNQLCAIFLSLFFKGTKTGWWWNVFLKFGTTETDAGGECGRRLGGSREVKGHGGRAWYTKKNNILKIYSHPALSYFGGNRRRTFFKDSLGLCRFWGCCCEVCWGCCCTGGPGLEDPSCTGAGLGATEDEAVEADGGLEATRLVGDLARPPEMENIYDVVGLIT